MKKYLILTIFTLFFIGCGANQPSFNQKVTNGEIYKRLYKENPTSILILPAVDKTNSDKADKFFSYSILPFLAEKGYYVFSPALVDYFLKSENITEPKMAREISLKKIEKIFNPDVILYVDINSWNSNYKVLSSGVNVGFDYVLKSANNGVSLWKQRSYVSSISNGHLDISNPITLLFSAAISAIKAGVNKGTDYQKLALQANYNAYYNFPLGKYHYNFGKDKDKIFGNLMVNESDIENFKRKNKINRNFNKFSKSVFAIKKPSKKAKGNVQKVYLKIDKDGNLMEKNGKLLFTVDND